MTFPAALLAEGSTDVARWVFTVFFILLAVFVFRFSRQEVLRGASDGSSWRDLRWWALLLVGLHVIIYWAF